MTDETNKDEVRCANCGDTPSFRVPNDSQWFCTQECYDEYNDIEEPDIFTIDN